MSEEIKYSKIYLVNIIVENDWGYHLDSLWYGSEPKNLALMIIDVMKSWYEPNKEVLGQGIREFHEKLERATAEDNPQQISFRELKGEIFHENGLKMTIESTNNLDEMYAFVFNESFDIFAVNGEKPEDFTSVSQYIDYLETSCKADEPIVLALKSKDENDIATAICMIDIKYDYAGRHYVPQSSKK